MRVEGAGGGGVVRQEIEVCVVPFEDEAAEGFLVWGAGAGRRGLAVCPMGWNKRGLKEQEKFVRRKYLISSSAEASMPASLSILMPSAKRMRGARPSGIWKLPASGYSRWMTSIQYLQRSRSPLKMEMRRSSAKSIISSQVM